MLSITAKVRKIKEELDSAIDFFKELLGEVENYTSVQLINETIGIYTQEIPDWEILKSEKEMGINLIWKICINEISILEAKKRLKEIISELEDTRRLIK